MAVQLQGESGTGINDDALDLEIGALFQNRVGSPWAMHHEMSFGHLRMGLLDFA